MVCPPNHSLLYPHRPQVHLRKLEDADFLFQTSHLLIVLKLLVTGLPIGVLCARLASQRASPEPHIQCMGYCQEEDERHQTRWAEGRHQRNLGYHNTSAAVPQADCLHATPHWSSSSCKSYQVLTSEMNILSWMFTFLYYTSFFIGFM